MRPNESVGLEMPGSMYLVACPTYARTFDLLGPIRVTPISESRCDTRSIHQNQTQLVILILPALSIQRVSPTFTWQEINGVGRYLRKISPRLGTLKKANKDLAISRWTPVLNQHARGFAAALIMVPMSVLYR